MRLDGSTWQALHEICRREVIALPHLLSRIQERRSTGESLTTATRRFVLEHSRSSFAGSFVSDTRLGTNPLMDLSNRFSPAIVRRMWQEAGEDYEQKLQFALTHLEQIETERVRQYWRDWLGMRSELGHTPFLESFVRDRFDDLGAADAINIIDVSAENPFGYRVTRLQSQSASFVGVDTTEQRIGEHPFTIHSQGMQTDFNFAKMSAMPVYHALRQGFRGLSRTYSRLILPFSSNGMTVDRLITVIRRIEPIHPELPRPTTPQRPRAHARSRRRA